MRDLTKSIQLTPQVADEIAEITGYQPPINLSKIIIPDEKTVPEATLSDLSITFNALKPEARVWHAIGWQERVVCSLARYCQKLEADNLRMRRCAKCDQLGGESCTGLICDECRCELEHSNIWLKHEVDRLRKNYDDPDDIISNWPGNCNV